jgi:L-amino acid N-acyltransferase YncA
VGYSGQIKAFLVADAFSIGQLDRNKPELLKTIERQTVEWSVSDWMKKRIRKNDQEREQQKQREHEQQVREIALTKALRKNSFLCRIPAHLRPATEDDMEGVTRIYNHEVINGWRALDQEPQTAHTFCNHLRYCRSEQIPFIVAMSGYRNPYVPLNEASHEVIGFAFLDIANRGIFGSSKSNAKHSGKVFIVVDPKVRRNRVATALLDRLLIITSRGYLEKEMSYQFINPKNDPVYEPELRNPRQWRVLQMEIYVKNQSNVEATQRGDEYSLIRDWLSIDFNFTMDSYTSNYGIAERQVKIYLDRVVFEHRCHDSDANWEAEA